jgi:hypothetical protein
MPTNRAEAVISGLGRCSGCRDRQIKTTASEPAKLSAKESINMKTKETRQVTARVRVKAQHAVTLPKIEEKEGPCLFATNEDLRQATGARSTAVAVWILSQADALQQAGGRTNETLARTLSLLAELAPSNVVEGMLTVQMIGVHNAAAEYLRRSQLQDRTVEEIDKSVSRACCLSRVFTRQLEAMAKLKGTAGRQRMTVEHVHVHAGGQAIVGPVATAGGHTENEGGAN